LARRTDIHASAAEAAFFRTDVKGSGNFSFVSPHLKADSLSVHLFSTHTYTQAAENAFFIPDLKANLFNSEFGSQILDDLGARGKRKHQFYHHPPGFNDSAGICSDHKTFFDWISTGRG
jgi:hypothetical protein